MTEEKPGVTLVPRPVYMPRSMGHRELRTGIARRTLFGDQIYSVIRSMSSFLKERSIFWHYGLATCWMALDGTFSSSHPAIARAGQSTRCAAENAKRTQHEVLRREPSRAFSVEFHVDSDR